MEYLGAAYAGFQRQPQKVTVQATLERAIGIITGESSAVVGSGRTDAGAHAFGQIAAFSTDSVLPADTLCRALNAHLPADIAVTSVRDVAPDFHPRFDARSRSYRYLIWNRQVRSPFWRGRAAHVPQPLDTERMDRALRLLEGRTDVSAFIPTRLEGNRERIIYRARCQRDGDLVNIDLTASGFMRQMVRAVAGTAIRVGRGVMSVDQFGETITARVRSLAGDTAPADGLYLMHVEYETDHHNRALQLARDAVPAAPAAPPSFEERR